MMQQLRPLDADELTLWLTRVTQTVDRSLRDPARAAAASSLADGVDSFGKLSLPVLIQLAFLADSLQVAQLAIYADGQAEPQELERVADLVGVASPKYAFVLPAYEVFGHGAVAHSDVAHFLAVHRDDPGPFGFRRSAEWRGHALARVVEESARNAGPLQAHERMLVRVMEAVFAGRDTAAEQAVRRRLRALFEQPSTSHADDPRTVAFCRVDSPDVFSSISHGSQFHERDPFDVETIHADARSAFHRQIERATTPEQAQHGHGSTLLILGDSGSGKTHLLRALRAQVHGQRLGYVGYLQVTSEIDDHIRYALRSLIDSLESPYDAPALTESGLMYLSDGLVEGRDAISPDDAENLRTADFTPIELDRFVGQLVDRVVRSEGLARFETDLVQALLLLQRRDPALQRRIVRFLRCETLNHHDRELLGGLGARDRAEDPLRTIVQLGKIMHELQLAALVLVVDQLEELVPDVKSVASLQHALDAMRAIADAVPSSVVVISCLQDMYETVSPRLSRSLLDRLQRDEIRLTSRRQPEEIEQMLVSRLEHLYNCFDVAWRDDDPLYPFTPAQINAVAQLRTRDCLTRFREFHHACIAARSLVRDESPSHGKGVVPPLLPTPALDLDRLWNETLVVARAPSDDDAEILSLVADTIRGAAIERDAEIAIRAVALGVLPHLVIEGKSLPRQVIALCNNAPQRGSFGAQLANLRVVAKKASATPVALRNGDFKFQPKTKTAQNVGEHIAAGGLAVPLAEAQLRVAAAARAMANTNPDGYLDWRRSKQLLAELAFIRQILDFDRDHAGERASPNPSPSNSAAERDAAPRSEPDGSERVDSSVAGGEPLVESGQVRVPSDAIRLGVVDSLRAEPIYVPLEDFKVHMAFLGSSGSGKTTAALTAIEQLLERGISVILVDRKGDLSRYASDAWWSDPTAVPVVRDRKLALRKRLDIALYTPGNSQGRPLRLPLVPSLVDIKPHEREQLAGYAATALGTMMGYGKSQAHKCKVSILQCAIALHATEREVTLQLLHEAIGRPDPELLNAVGALQRHFGGLSEDLQALDIQRGALLSGDGESLDVGALLPPLGATRTRLSIINTSALTDVSILQFWVSRLLVELGRLGRKRPSATLQAATFFDEADAYLPAQSVPPTKEPMFDLLRRARSTGIGVLLATQNPGDFDYKARDNVNTWLLGKITQEAAISKMRNLIGDYPDVGPRLASQRTGSFFLLTGQVKRELKADRSLMETVQLPESEVAELARRTRTART
jgi:energy-coupling factor transporter ATP-binding protein EcfA2